ncbi:MULTISPECIES: YqgE/AlgH family protein [unclassified Janthinobacterium]|uniref:YqgE/AlgH family protein n=1 Tax=unclassified Janthinobacterium TaxID=2610881 RepID=UPI0017CA74E5|nr:MULTISPECIES: YqgE/AlgH family protein [unclassified Janthinobacterium]MBB5607602.1 putative transcriptional regulator [Janthinobacterium sp. S3T4]MBB5612624.1 putative transcriptional regulator [Janthinobacterium sp. S3M3]
MKKSKIDHTLPGHRLMQGVSELAAPGASTLNLANHFLIAMPAMQDPVFGGTVVYVCEHNENGVLGVVINKPTDMTMEVLFDRIDLKLAGSSEAPIVNEPIMFGGPVQDDRGFVLHTPGARYSSSLTVTDEVAFTTSIDVLEAVAKGDGPERMLVSIGYSGWSPGQLEDEIGRNGWLTVGASADILFDFPIEDRYVAAIKLLGIDPLMLASEAGHA